VIKGSDGKSTVKTTEQYLDADEEELTEAMGKGVEED
jgi:hypothetical protein